MIIQVTVTNAEGNVTAFVHNDIDASSYGQIATSLLALPSYGIEQVAFIKSTSSENFDGQMEMAGHEFCGNATRSFGLLTAKENLKRSGEVLIKTSGVNEILSVFVDINENTSRIRIPKPKRIFSPEDIQTIDDSALKATLEKSKFVEFSGIFHVVSLNCTPTEENAASMIDYIKEKYSPQAVGIMYYNQKTSELTPIVHVCGINTTKREGSCCSGTTALAYVLSQNLGEGDFTYDIKQPGGTLRANIIKTSGDTQIFIDSKIKIAPIKNIEI